MADEIPSTGEERPHTKALGGGEAGAGEVYQDSNDYLFCEMYSPYGEGVWGRNQRGRNQRGTGV